MHLSAGRAYSFGGSAESHLIPPPSLHGREGSYLPGIVPPNDMLDSKSVVGIKHGYSGMVITHTRSADYFVNQSHIYPRFIGKVSTLTHFPL